MNNPDIQSPFPFIHVDLNRDPNPSHHFFFPNRHDHLSLPSARFLLPQPHLPHHQEHHPHRANFVDELIIAQGGPRDHPTSDVIEGDRDLYHEHGHDHHHHHGYCSVKWMSSKMRIMKKMTSGGGKSLAAQKFMQHPKREAVPPIILENDSNPSSISGIESSSNNNNSIIIRVCSDCNTTKTPLWRSGPRGPKSLCNACGIRQRKARRAMALAAAATNGEPLPCPIPEATQKAAKLLQHKKKKKKKGSSLSENKDDDESDQNPKKKRKRTGMIVVHPPADTRKLCFEELMLRLSERISGLQGMFPQDEKEAAILLMALSYGFVQS